MATALVVVFAAHPGRADVFDEARLWYRDFADRNGNGMVDSGEIRDCLHAGNATDIRNQSTKRGTGDLGFSIEDVRCQYSQKTLSGVSCLDLPQEDGKPTMLDTGYKSSATDFTAFIRFKRGSLYDAEQYCWLLNIGYGNNGGLLVGFEKDYGCLYVYSEGKRGIIYKDNSVGSNITFGQNAWTEMAVVANGTRLTIYARKNNYQNIRYDIELTKTISPDPDMTLKLGGGDTVGSHVFRGKIHQFAYWEKALTEAEVFEALSYTGVESIDLWQAGSRVSGACPFGGVSGAAVDLGDTSTNWFSGAHWFDIPAVWTAGTSITTQFEVPEFFGGLNQTVAVAASSGKGKVRIFVDGNDVGESGVAVNNWSRCLIPGSLMTEGKHTLKIEHSSGEFIPKFMSLAGSWQLGTSYSDKATANVASEDYHVKTRNLKKLRYANGTKSTGEKYAVSIHFDQDMSEAGGRYEFSFNCFGSNPKSDAVELYVNETLKATYSATDWSGTKTVDIGFDEFKAGENIIRFVNADTSHAGTATYMACNWYRLEIIRPANKCFIISFR